MLIISQYENMEVQVKKNMPSLSMKYKNYSRESQKLLYPKS